MMYKSTALLTLLLLTVLILSACGGDDPMAQPTASGTVVPTSSSVAPATVSISGPTNTAVTNTSVPSAEPTVSTAGAGDEIPNGVNAEGFYYLGSPNAKITLTDYSDFL